MNHLTPTGECNCKKPTFAQVYDETLLAYGVNEVLAQSRFHAEAIREALNFIGKAEFYSEREANIGLNVIYAVLKCMEGEKE
jgi:hypothetical protein